MATETESALKVARLFHLKLNICQKCQILNKTETKIQSSFNYAALTAHNGYVVNIIT